MSKLEYILEICGPQEKLAQINRIFGVNASIEDNVWEYRIVINNKGEFTDPLGKFANMISSNLGELKEIGVNREDITIWKLYEYVDQCNMEFSPEQLSTIGSLGITFCISCWQKGSKIILESSQSKF